MKNEGFKQTEFSNCFQIKCQKYWPESEQGELLGDIKVEMIDEILLAEYVVRRFTITQVTVRILV